MSRLARLDHPEDLDAIELVRVRLALLEPFVSSHGVERDREVVLVRAVGSDGVAGWGECVALSQPTYTGEHTAGAWQVLRDELVPDALDGRDVAIDGRRMAWAAIESAYGDWRRRRVDPARATNRQEGIVVDAVRCGVVVGRTESIAALLDAVAARVAEGYVQVKLKIGPGWDVEPLRAVRERWPDLALAADANGSFALDDPAQARALHALDELGLTYLEQPLAAGALDATARLRATLQAPIALDESVSSVEDLEQALEAGALDVLNVKPGRVGGELEFLRIRRVLREHGLPAFVGGMLETGVGRAFALHCATYDVCSLPTDLGPSSRYFAEDLTEPFVMRDDGTMVVPDAPGYGAVVREDRVDAAAVDRLLIEPRRPRARFVSPPLDAAPSPRGWKIVTDEVATATSFHERPWPDPLERTVWGLTFSHDALVLGSTQHDAIVDRDALVALDARGSEVVEDAPAGRTPVDVVRRRSGGGAVWLPLGSAVWLDVLLPRGDALWDDDVNRSFLWLGETWCRALAALGLPAEVHRGGLSRTGWSDLVCFAGLGPGEVSVEGRKAVGLSQRRTRRGARFQCVAYTGLGAPAAAIVDHLAVPDDAAARDALRRHLVETVCTIPARSSDLVHAFLAELPA